MNTEQTSVMDDVLKGLGVGCAILALLMPGQVTSSQKEVQRNVAHVQQEHVNLVADFGDHTVSDEARHLARWAMHSRDTQGMPFVIVDKKNVTVHVFSRDGKLRGTTPVLLGSAIGDDSVDGIGERELSGILPHERTTPSGRFVTMPGRNSAGEDIVWVDYDAAVSMHRVRATVASERRLQRLASATPDDNRISFGCINVPVQFYDEMIHPVLGAARAVVYVLPETRTVRDEFGSYDVPDAPAMTAAASQSR